MTNQNRYLEEKPYRGQAPDAGKVRLLRTSSGPLQDQFQYRFGAKVGEHQ